MTRQSKIVSRAVTTCGAEGVDTQIQPITGSCMEARPKGHLARVLKVVQENKVS